MILCGETFKKKGRREIKEEGNEEFLMF